MAGGGRRSWKCARGVLALARTLVACSEAAPPESTPPPAAAAQPAEIASIRLRDGGEIRLQFFPDQAPGHVANFKKLARAGYYDGTTFHRVIPDFMVQGGDALSKDDDPTNDGTGSPGYALPPEPSEIRHGRGIVSMASRDEPESDGAQFFIVLSDDPHWRKLLDGRYTAFGEVTAGMTLVDQIATAPRDTSDRPLEDQVIESVSILPPRESPAPPAE